MVVEGIKALLGGLDTLEVAGAAYSGREAMERLAQQPADVALVDINLPDMSGIDLCKNLKSRFPKMRVLALSTFKERSYITRMIEAGASGYLLKNASAEELEEAVLTAAGGRLYLSMEAAETLTQTAAAPALPLLTQREKEVLGLIAEGHTNGEIADRLFISPLTVDSHRKNLLAKFGVRNTAAMIKYALEYGLL
jgi:DNA-binding NarL/FixJ family response regulator